MKRLLPLLLLTGCVSWHGLPVAPAATPHAGLLRYRIQEFPMVSFGMVGLESALRGGTGFARAERVKEPPAEGLFVDIRADWHPPSKAAQVFGYISLVFLTATPAWSTRDGWTVHYDLYRDGARLDVYSYRVGRKGALWLGLLPLAWVNLLTTSEDEALAATLRRFLSDAAPWFSPS